MKKKIRINIFLPNQGENKRFKKKNNYPDDRNKPPKKECPYCSKMFDARGLHPHILRIHGINISEGTQVILPKMTKVNEVITLPISKVTRHQPNELLDKETITWYYESLQACIEAIFPKLKVFLEAYDIFNRFWKAELREEINSLSKSSPSFKTISFTWDYELTVTIEYLEFNDDLHPHARFRLKEFTRG